MSKPYSSFWGKCNFTYPKWYSLWLWIYPTHENVIYGEAIVRFKKVKGRTYIIDIKPLIPLKGE